MLSLIVENQGLGDIFCCFVQSYDCGVWRQWHGWEKESSLNLSEEKWFPALAWFVSQIFLLLFWLISPRTFYYWQYLSQAGCGSVWCEPRSGRAGWSRQNYFWLGKTEPCVNCSLHPKEQFKNDCFWRSHRPSKDDHFFGGKFFKEYRKKAGRPMSNHYFSV